jgi:hypothetical protein
VKAPNWRSAHSGARVWRQLRRLDDGDPGDGPDQEERELDGTMAVAVGPSAALSGRPRHGTRARMSTPNPVMSCWMAANSAHDRERDRVVRGETDRSERTAEETAAWRRRP